MGWAIVDYDDQAPRDWGVVDLRNPEEGWPESQVIRAIRDVRSELRALGYDVDEVYVIGIESAYHGASIAGTITHAGMVGMAMAAAQIILGRQATVYPLHPASWPPSLGIRGKSGKRADVKAATIAWASALVGQPVLEDAADAIGLATAAARATERVG